MLPTANGLQIAIWPALITMNANIVLKMAVVNMIMIFAYIATNLWSQTSLKPQVKNYIRAII